MSVRKCQTSLPQYCYVGEPASLVARVVDAGLAVMRVGVRSVSRQARVDQLSYLKTLGRKLSMTPSRWWRRWICRGFRRRTVPPARRWRYVAPFGIRGPPVSRWPGRCSPSTRPGCRWNLVASHRDRPWAGWRSIRRHAEVIEHACAATRRAISPQQWAPSRTGWRGGAELPARRVGQVGRAHAGAADQDAAPNDDEPQVNELHLSASADGWVSDQGSAGLRAF